MKGKAAWKGAGTTFSHDMQTSLNGNPKAEHSHFPIMLANGRVFFGTVNLKQWIIQNSVRLGLF